MCEFNNLCIDLCVYVAKLEQKSFWKSHFSLIGSILTNALSLMLSALRDAVKMLKKLSYATSPLTFFAQMFFLLSATFRASPSSSIFMTFAQRRQIHITVSFYEKKSGSTIIHIFLF